MRPTVHDIAAEAGVSLATVDRVLNRRPGVRTVTRLKVEEAIGRIGYVRDVAAANLAKGRIYPLIFILPSGDNSFMRGLERHVRAAILRSSAERTAITVKMVPAFDPAALAQALDDALAVRPAGVAVVAIDAPIVVEKIDALKAAQIPVVTLVSDVTQSRRDHFAGVDNIAAGRTAGSLMGRFLGGRSGPIALLAGSMLVRDHRERLEGFTEVLLRRFAGHTLLPVLEGHDDPLRAEQLICDAFAAHPDIAGIYSLGAGNRGLIAALKARGRGPGVGRPACVIVHELTVHTRTALDEGLIDAVLNQDAGHEVRSAIRVLKAKADGVSVIGAQERIRIDIFLKDNLPFDEGSDREALFDRGNDNDNAPVPGQEE